jgi:hypothetical protein
MKRLIVATILSMIVLGVTASPVEGLAWILLSA